MPQPRTIHDFGGFPKALYDAEYPAPGSEWLAEETRRLIQSVPVVMDQDWGLDHGCWSVLNQMFPQADIPVVELSMDYSKPAQFHYDLGRELSPLRKQGVLILASGNIVHNLRRVVLRGFDLTGFNEPFGSPWALEAQALFKKLIDSNDHQALINYPSLGSCRSDGYSNPRALPAVAVCPGVERMKGNPSRTITMWPWLVLSP